MVKICSSELSPAAVEGRMKEVMDGILVPLVELEYVTDWPSIKNVCVLDIFYHSIGIHSFLPQVSQA